MKVDQNHCVVQVHVRKYQTNKTVITLNYKQHAKGYYIDNGGEVRGGYLPKNMTMQIKDGNCNVEMGMFQTLYHLFESEYVILSLQSRIFRLDTFPL